MDDEIKILPAGLLDLNDLRRLEKVCFLKDAWPLLDLIGILTMPGVLRLKAVIDTRMVGFAAGEVRAEEGVGWVNTLGVEPEVRRRGVASLLLTVCEERLGTSVVRLCVRRSNEPARQLYLRRGYIQADVWDRYYNDGEDALVLEKSGLNLSGH